MANSHDILPLGLDFYYYWAAADVLRMGGNPYDPVAIAANFAAPGLAVPNELLFPYLPMSLAWLLPLAYLPVAWALYFWFAVLLVATVGIFIFSRQMFVAVAGLPQLTLLCLFLSFPPLLRGLMLGQVTVLLSALVIGGIYLSKSNRPFVVGLLLSFGLWKPQAYLILFLVICLNSFHSRDLRLIFGF